LAGNAGGLRPLPSKEQTRTADSESSSAADYQAVPDMAANAILATAGRPVGWDSTEDNSPQGPDDWRRPSTGDGSVTLNPSGHVPADSQRAMLKPPSSPDTAHSNSPAPAPATSAAPAAPPLHSALVLQRMDKAEIRIGLQSENFGAIRLHTSVVEDQVGASVSTSHPGLRNALVVEAESLEKAMARHSLRLDAVQLDTNAANTGFNSFGSNQRQPQARPGALPARWQGTRQPAASTVSSAVPVASPAGDRLDVHV